MHETLTVITTPVTAVRLGQKVIPMETDSFRVQGWLNARGCYAHKLVGTVCVAVTIPQKRQTNPNEPFYGRRVLDWEAANEKLARAVAKESARQGV